MSKENTLHSMEQPHESCWCVSVIQVESNKVESSPLKVFLRTSLPQSCFFSAHQSLANVGFHPLSTTYLSWYSETSTVWGAWYRSTGKHVAAIDWPVEMNRTENPLSSTANCIVTAISHPSVQVLVSAMKALKMIPWSNDKVHGKSFG